eukprot:COSAG01_NODE_6636_length_3568_cov_5.432113_8_plen_144_part_00
MPKTLRFTNVSIAYLTGSCNNKPSLPKATDEEPLIMDEVAWSVGTVAIVVYQLPNCPIVYPSDPSQKKRTEDAMIAWGWKQCVPFLLPACLPACQPARLSAGLRIRPSVQATDRGVLTGLLPMAGIWTPPRGSRIPSGWRGCR